MYIDTKNIIENDIKKNQYEVGEYYSKIDFHYSEKANKLFAEEIKKLQRITKTTTIHKIHKIIIKIMLPKLLFSNNNYCY